MNPKGVISGTPLENTSGTYPVIIQVTDGIATVSTNLLITINPKISISYLADGMVGAAYSQTLSASTTGILIIGLETKLYPLQYQQQ
jgi:hypothetical protein